MGIPPSKPPSKNRTSVHPKKTWHGARSDSLPCGSLWSSRSFGLQCLAGQNGNKFCCVLKGAYGKPVYAVNFPWTNCRYLSTY